MLLVKEEEKEWDSEAEDGYNPPEGRHNPQNQNQQRPEMCTTATQVEVSDTGVGMSDSSSGDDEPPTEEATKTARELVVYYANKQLVEDPDTTTALIQALAKSGFEFKTAKGTKKTCGVDFLNVEIPRDAKVKKSRAKKKGTGKKSGPGHNSAQERDPEVLELKIGDNEMFKEPENAAAADARASGQAVTKKRGRSREKTHPPQKHEGHRTRKIRSSSSYHWIKFFHDEYTRAAKEAKEERSSYQLLVHGLPKEFISHNQAGKQEKALNNLMAGLSRDTLGAEGINIVQQNIIGAHEIDPTPGEKSPIIRITLDSRETKASIRRAAEIAERWGNGTHPVFFRDITLNQRKRKDNLHWPWDKCQANLKQQPALPGLNVSATISKRIERSN